MKFRLMSDLHLEFESRVTNFTPIPRQADSETVLILAGDIATGVNAAPFIAKMCERFRKVVYVLGNHEFYNHEYNSVRAQWAAMSMPHNFILLDDAVAYLDDQVRVIGGTLWTSFNDGDWFSMQRARQSMNDYHVISINDAVKRRRLLPDDTAAAHAKTVATIKAELEKDWNGNTLVVTHHLPHLLCVHPQFRGSPLNPAYVTNLDELFRQHEIDVWVHGHTHCNVDVEVHGTRILCNPRGYVPHELNKDFDDGLTFDI